MDAHGHGARHPDDDSRSRALLRGHGALEERALSADAGVRVLLHDRRSMGDLRILGRVQQRQRLLRRVLEDVPVGRERGRGSGDLLQGRRDPGARLRCVPAHLRGNHSRAHRRRVRRAGEVLRRAGVRGPLVHLRLPADRAHGLVLGRPRCDHRREDAGNRHRSRRLAVGEGRPGLRRRHGRAPECRCRWPRRCLRHRQARRLRQGVHGSAQPAAHDGRRMPPVGGLVRLQRRLQPGSQRHDRGGLPEHPRGHGLRDARLVADRIDRQGQGLDARRGVRCSGRPGRDHPGLRIRRHDGRAGDRRSGRPGLLLGRERPEADARRG